MTLPSGWLATGWQIESGQAWVHRVARAAEPDGTLYALKQLKNPSRRERFALEVRAMRKLRDTFDGVVPEIIAADLDSSRPWFVMPWFNGGSLENAVGDGRFRADLGQGLSRLEQLAYL